MALPAPAPPLSFAKLFFRRSDQVGLGRDLRLLAEAWGLRGITMLALPALQGDLMERNLSQQLQQAIWCGFFSSPLGGFTSAAKS